MHNLIQIIKRNIKECSKHIPYTETHRKIIFEMEKKAYGYIKHKSHDLDKIILFKYMPWLGEKRIAHLHQLINRHHSTFKIFNKQFRKPICMIDMEQFYFDIESARFSKPDKPLDSVNTCIKFYPWLVEYIRPIKEKYNNALKDFSIN